MINYQVVKESLWDQYLGHYTAFGVNVYFNQGDVKEKITCVSDVFLDQEKADQFVCHCNQTQLDVVDLLSAIEEAIRP